MKFVVNLDLCESYGICAFTTPDQFELRDDGQLVFRDEAESEYVSPDLDPDAARGAQTAADACPLQAIRMVS
ncbi:ferredoxin [Aeromicrobium fastidiosum]|uniref:Ferredoxin n=1 Tax=Aeromicrobium fastidiosum TaxID=52699 RepID=A0A641APA6_9ACTN|nr:ferredoxin [Aeromicrobium fastidiosum]KAA1379920.1 ferredoxin [Aeromicrobium fastidiosum]MBP2389426.1 ferredoxin [Aeromicrobium fastidiosum]